MFKKTIAFLLACSCMCFFPIQANAEEGLDYSTLDNDEIIQSIGLIENYFLSCSTGTKKIHIKMKTIGSWQMDEIGFKNIQIQRYTGSGWYTEKTISSLTTTNAFTYYISDYTTSVLGGYYYRVSLDHYAKNGSTTESCNNFCGSVWID